MNESTYVEMIQDLLKSEQIGSDQLVKSFNMIFMADSGNYIPGSFLSESGPAEVFGHPARWMAFMALLIGFAIKLSVFPFHTWLPDAHVEAPTPVSVVLAGVLLKIGGYGIIRTAYAMFPDAAFHYAWLIGFLGLYLFIMEL